MPTVDYFLNIDGIPGESVDSKHPNEIVVQSWSFGESAAAPAGASGAAAGKVKFRDFRFTAVVSKASPKLMEACATGQHIKSAVLTCRKSTGFQLEFLVLKFSDLVVAGCETGATADSEMPPVDHVALAFAKVEIDYTGQRPDGTPEPPIQVTI
ncbi:MAG TPA: type VI secretion system tube protein Hcp [Stellaceae bacterium]|nr:type VI secretion system tube protein Hcp [Stellaceae bacterium]